MDNGLIQTTEQTELLWENNEYCSETIYKLGGTFNIEDVTVEADPEDATASLIKAASSDPPPSSLSTSTAAP